MEAPIPSPKPKRPLANLDWTIACAKAGMPEVQLSPERILLMGLAEHLAEVNEKREALFARMAAEVAEFQPTLDEINRARVLLGFEPLRTLTPAMQPAKQDRALAEELFDEMVPWAGEREVALTRAADLLHRNRLHREHGLLGALRKLEGLRLTHSEALRNLQSAYERNYANMKHKIRDCDFLKDWLVRLGWDRRLIGERLKANATVVEVKP